MLLKSARMLFVSLMALGAIACAHVPKAPTARGFDPAAESFESVERGADQLRRQGDADEGVTYDVQAALPPSGLDVRSIVRESRRSPASQDFDGALFAKIEQQNQRENESPAQAPVGIECETGYDCPSGQFCRTRAGAQEGAKKVCVGGTGTLNYCQSSIDCPNGTCKDRGDGIKICIGGGVKGSACVSNSDCRIGLCRDRGDGVKLCLGNGQRNDVCTTTSDCAVGNCKDRGDGLKVCM